MKLTRPAAKVFANTAEVTAGELIELFHRWIQTKRIDDHLLFDVADYSHVKNGPGVLLVSHEAYFGWDHGGGRQGVLYRRRLADPYEALHGLRTALRHALEMATLLEEDLGAKMRFDAAELVVGADDRLLAPNDEATFMALQPDLNALAANIFGDAEKGVRIDRGPDPKACFRAHLHGPGPLSAADTLRRLARSHDLA